MTTAFIFHSTLAAFIAAFLAKGNFSNLAHTIMDVYHYPAGDSQVNNRK
jgi:hypothetical protein